MRLIDANAYDAILKNREETLIEYSGSLSGAIRGCRALLDEAPTVDAAPVVHGFNTYDHDSAFECSVCGFNDWDTLTADSGKYNYCPGCGAKMDGEKDG